MITIIKKWFSKYKISNFHIIYISSFLILVLNLTFTKILNLKPCFLCNIQKSIYLLLFICSLLGIITKYKKYFFYFIIAVLFLGIIIAFYHSLIQYGFLKDPYKITSKVTNINMFEDLIFKSTSSCFKIIWSLLDISIAVHNIGIYSLLLFLTKKYNNKHI